ncbi:succinate semialdehyde dehydrogenase-like [Bolinopsis microptera]|uniref:succinate semialdehyde dehydrogenase-like n=1 Tax=Bolinopsis microptera TaxID=2820187 RepID=UPI00307A53A9
MSGISAALLQSSDFLLGDFLRKEFSIHLELGGNAPLIVFESADIDRAVDGTMLAKFRNAGQACSAANRILINKSVYAEFVEKLAKKVAKLKMGNGLDEGISVGPLVNSKAHAKVASLVESREVGRLAPDSLCNVYATENNELPIFHEEIFGPVASLFSFDTETEAVEMANNTRYGLQAYIFTQELSQAWRVSENLECGMVAVNEGAIRSANNPFGGWKESGIGREAGHLGIDEFTEDKLICFGL